MRPLLCLLIVGCALEDTPRPVEETSPESPYFTFTCSPDSFLTTPIASQCCSDTTLSGSSNVFLRTSDATIVKRFANDTACGNGLVACCPQNNVGTCAGNACYWGPFGFSRATLTTWDPTRYAMRVVIGNPTSQTESYCTTQQYPKNTAPAPTFGDITGTRPRSAGCCLDGSGPCNATGFPLCTACGGGGLAGLGAWDY